MSEGFKLRDDVEAWYIWVINKFRPFYEIGKDLSGRETVVAANRVGYDIISLMGCKQVAFSRALIAFFKCGDRYIVYDATYVQVPRKSTRRKVEELERTIDEQYFSLDVPLGFTEVRIAVGKQPVVGTDFGRVGISDFKLEYHPSQGLTIHLIPPTGFIPSSIMLGLEPTGMLSLGGIPGPLSTKEEREYVERAVTILTAIYENRYDINNYIDKAYEFLTQLFKGLSIYLLY
jgi:hypothetical protein